MPKIKKENEEVEENNEVKEEIEETNENIINKTGNVNFSEA